MIKLINRFPYMSALVVGIMVMGGGFGVMFSLFKFLIFLK